MRRKSGQEKRLHPTAKAHVRRSPQPKQLFIRRVQAIVDVPIKSEGSDDGLHDPAVQSHSESETVLPSLGVGSITSGHKRKSASHRSKIIESENESSHQRRNGSVVHEHSEDDDEDDELMMGAEVSAHNMVHDVEIQRSSGQPQGAA